MRSLKPIASTAAAAAAAAGDGLAARYAAFADDGSRSHDSREAARLFAAAERHLESSQPSEALRVAGEALEQFRRAQDAAGEADAQRLVVSALCLQERFTEAYDAAAAQLQAFRDAGSRRSEAAMLLSLADVDFLQGRLLRALENAAKAKAAFVAEGDETLEVSALLTLARLHLAAESPAASLSSAQAALERCRRLGDDKGRARALRCIARAQLAEASLEAALATSAAALELLLAQRCLREHAYELVQLSAIHLQRRRPQDALVAAKDAEARFAELGCTAGRGLALGAAVDAYLLRNEWAAALAATRRHLEVLRGAGDKLAEASILGGTLLKVHVAEGNLSEAAKAAEAALTLCRELRDGCREACVLDNLALLQLLRRQLREAAQSGQLASQLFAALGDQVGEAGAEYRLSVVSHQCGEHWDALRHAARAHELFGAAGLRASAAMAMLAEGFAKQSLGEPAAAENLLHDALVEAQKAGNRRVEAAALVNLAEMNLSGVPDSKPDAGLIALQRAEAALRAAGGAEHALADVLHMMTLAHLQLGELAASQRPAHEAQVLFQRVGDAQGEVDILRIVANIELELLFSERQHQEQSQLRSKAAARLQASALKSAERAVKLARQSCGSAALAMALHSLAQVLNACGLSGRALLAAEEAGRLFREMQELSREGHSFVVAADACTISGDRQRARDLVERAVVLFQALGDAEGEALAKSVLSGSVLAAVADAPKALPAAEAAKESLAERPSLTALDFDLATTMAREAAFQAIGTDDELELDSALMDAGLDSLAAITFREMLMATSGLKLPTSLVFDYPSLIAITRHMVEVSTDPSMKV